MNPARKLSWPLQFLAGGAVVALSIFTNHIYSSPSPAKLLAILLLTVCACFAIIFSQRFAKNNILPIASQELFSSNAGQVDYLKFLRFLAALIVFIMHSGIVLGLDFTHANSSWAWLIFSPAWFGMSIFFTLSGYLIIKGFLTSRFQSGPIGATHFIDGRIRRLLPLMFVTYFGITGLTTWLKFDLGGLGSILVFAFNGKYAGSGGTTAFWSLSTEFHYYLIAPIIASVAAWHQIKKTSIMGLIVFCIFFGISARFLAKSIARLDGINLWVHEIWTPFYGHLDEFLLGGVACLAVIKHGKKFAEYKRLWPFVIIAGYLIYSWIAYPVMSGLASESQATKELSEKIFVYVAPSIGALSTAICICLIESNDATQKCALANKRPLLDKIFTTMAGMTFSFYLLHSPILMAIHANFKEASYATQLAIASMGTLCGSYIIYSKLEPWLARKIQMKPLEKFIFNSQSMLPWLRFLSEGALVQSRIR